MITFPGAMGDLSVSEVEDSYHESAHHLNVSSMFIQPKIRDKLLYLFSRAKQKRMSTSLDVQSDPEEKWDIDFERILPLVDVILQNINELTGIAHKKKIDEVIEMFKPFANTLVVKMGVEGSVGIQGGKRINCRSFLDDHVVDAIGAGDSFNADFSSTFLRGKSMSDCLQFSNICGAINTTAAGETGLFTNLVAVQKNSKKAVRF